MDCKCFVMIVGNMELSKIFCRVSAIDVNISFTTMILHPLSNKNLYENGRRRRRRRRTRRRRRRTCIGTRKLVMTFSFYYNLYFKSKSVKKEALSQPSANDLGGKLVASENERSALGWGGFLEIFWSSKFVFYFVICVVV